MSGARSYLNQHKLRRVEDLENRRLKGKEFEDRNELFEYLQ